jgi:hypothetical protein
MSRPGVRRNGARLAKGTVDLTDPRLLNSVLPVFFDLGIFLGAKNQRPVISLDRRQIARRAVIADCQMRFVAIVIPRCSSIEEFLPAFAELLRFEAQDHSAFIAELFDRSLPAFRYANFVEMISGGVPINRRFAEGDCDVHLIRIQR